jgi:hypothetical protein
MNLGEIADRLISDAIGKYPYTYDLPDPDLISVPAARSA